MKYFIPKKTSSSRFDEMTRKWENGIDTERDVWYDRKDVIQNSGCMIFQLPAECFPYKLIEVFRSDVVEE